MPRLLFLAVLIGGVAWWLMRSPDDSGGADALERSEDVAHQVASSADVPTPAASSSPAAGTPGGEPGGLIDNALAGWLAAGELAGQLPGLQKAAESDPNGVAAALLDLGQSDPELRWRGITRVIERLPAGHPRTQALQKALPNIARDAITTPNRSVEYVVVPGDALAKIAKRVRSEHGIVTTAGMIRWANRLTGDKILPKQRLRVPKDPLRIAVSKRDFTLWAYLGDGLVRAYDVGLGRDGRTPEATFVIDSRLVKAPWPDPETGKILHYGEPGYQIGTRWLGFRDEGPNSGFGIHGTDKPDSIGKNESLGCVRLRDADVEDLFELVPEGTLVTIQ